MVVGNKLKYYRDKKKISQQQAAEHLSISRNSYQLKETGQREFTQTEIEGLKDLFDKTYDELFFKDEN